MDPFALQAAALPIHAPMTVATNVALAVQCAVISARVRTERGPVGRRWAGFFGWMAAATAFGAVKHGLDPSTAPVARTAALVASNLASGVAVYRAQLAALGAHAPRPSHPSLSILARLQLAGLVTWTCLAPSAAVAVVNAGLGLLPVVAAEGRAAAGAGAAARTLVGGFGLAAVAGVVYGVGEGLPGPVGATDAAHIVMLGAFALLGSGALARSRELGARPAPEAPAGRTP